VIVQVHKSRCRGAEVMLRRWCRPGAGTGAKVQRYRVAEVVQRCRGPMF
jgi:hypothetical protein